MVESITGRAFAVCIAIRSRRCLFLGRMSTAAAAAGARLGPIASARFSRVGTNIVRHGNSNRLGEHLGRRIRALGQLLVGQHGLAPAALTICGSSI